MTVVERTVLPLLVWLALMTQASAGETGYVFVSEEGTNNVAVIDPYRAYQVIKWIATDRRPRDMKFHDKGKQLLVACGGDDVIDVQTLEVVDHIPTGHDPEAFEISQDQRTGRARARPPAQVSRCQLRLRGSPQGARRPPR